MPEEERARLLPALDPDAQEALRLLLELPARERGRDHDDGVRRVPTTWTVEQALAAHPPRSAARRRRCTRCTSWTRRHGSLVHVVSLRELMLSRPRPARGRRSGSRRKPLTVTPRTDREEVARLISKYNLLAVPVVDDRRARARHRHGRRRDRRASWREQTEDVQKFGGMEALDEPYMEISFVHMIRKRAGWLCALFLGEMLTATAMGTSRARSSKAVVLALFIPLIISSGGNSGLAGDVAHHPRAGAARGAAARLVARRAARAARRGSRSASILGVIGVVPDRAVAAARLVRLWAALAAGRADGRRPRWSAS